MANELNPFEKVRAIAQIAKEKEWADKEELDAEDNSLKKIINRPSQIHNYAYDAFVEFNKPTDHSNAVDKEDDLS